jgi:VanZ family protein
VNFPPSGPDSGAPAQRPAPSADRLKSFRLASAIIWTVLILVLCWLPLDVVQKIEHRSTWFEIPDLDKVIHAGLFTVLAILWRRLAPAKSTKWAIVLSGFALGALTELGQLVPFVNRNAELYDLVTDCVGVVVGVAIAPLVEPLLPAIEHRLIRSPLPPAPTAAEQ